MRPKVERRRLRRWRKWRPWLKRSGTKFRSRLFTKYVALFVAVVAVALISNGIFEVFFYYREHKAP